MKNKILVQIRLVVILIVILFISVQVSFSKVMDETTKVRVQKACQTVDKSPSYTTKVLGGKRNANILRKFRDEILAINPQGKEYIKLFYQLLPDAVLVMIKNSHIRTRTTAVAIQIVPLIEPALEKEYIPSEIGEMLNSLLDDFANTKEASENLRNNILRMKEETPLMGFISRFNNASFPSLYSSGKMKHETPHTNKYSREHILVKFKSGTLRSRICEIFTEVGIIKDKHYKDINVYKIKVPSDNVMEIIDKLLKYDEIKYAEPDHTVRIHQTTPDDPDFDKLWGLHNTGQDGGTLDADIDAPEAWDTITGGSVVVAVIDSGVNYNHEDLASNMWVNEGEIPDNGVDDDGNGYIDDYLGWDFVNEDNDPMDDNDHGTHCSGTIGATGNNGKGVVGVNWTVKIMPLKFINQCGSGSISDAIEAILYSKNMGVKISSNSWGGGGYSQALYDAIEEFGNEGGLFVVSAGNEGNNNDNEPSYPASYDLPNIIAVAATDRNDNLASFSNFGVVSVDVAAPGVDIYSTVIAGYEWFNGTSMAAPQVAGIAALIKTQYPDLEFAGIKNAILNSVDIKLSLVGKIQTAGRANALNALNY